MPGELYGWLLLVLGGGLVAMQPSMREEVWSGVDEGASTGGWTEVACLLLLARMSSRHGGWLGGCMVVGYSCWGASFVVTHFRQALLWVAPLHVGVVALGIASLFLVLVLSWFQVQPLSGVVWLVMSGLGLGLVWNLQQQGGLVALGGGIG